MDIKYTIGTKT